MIEILKETSHFIEMRNKFFTQTIGFVPTMGNLHEGHLSLIRKSLSENDVTVVSIFVNPKQFGEGEDFDQYPRTLDDDIKKIRKLDEKKILIFAPQNPSEIFPEGFSTQIQVQRRKILCDKFRPGHFDGVTTVVYQLFKIVRPFTAYFGQKDFQQFSYIKQMVDDLQLSVELSLCPTIREDSGIALSSRNQYLKTGTDKAKSLELFKTLSHIEQLILSNQDYTSYRNEKMAQKEWQYLEVLNAKTLQEDDGQSNSLVILGAMYVGETRLIDNILVSKGSVC